MVLVLLGKTEQQVTREMLMPHMQIRDLNCAALPREGENAAYNQGRALNG